MTDAIKDNNCELISRRWAKALMELVREDSNNDTQAILSDLNFISETISSSEELSNVINNPSISTEEKQIILCKLFQDKVNSLVYNFVFALNLKKRVGIISDIAVEFEKELEKLNNITHVSITSALELNDGRKEEIRNRVASKLNKDVVVDWGVDEDIIAGLIFNIDEMIVDNSIRHKLDDLSRSIGVNVT